jgi:hypothetical protein
MMPLKRFLTYYVHGSFHVALMVLCFYVITTFQWELTLEWADYLLVFSLSFLAYNFIRYYPHAQTLKNWKSKPVLVFIIGILCLFTLYYFFSLSIKEKILLICCGGLCFFYVIPFNKREKTLRTSFGIKIFIVALCWTLISAVFPLLSLATSFKWFHFLFFIERFILLVVAILPFEIQDLHIDSELETLPQLIGIQRTQWLGVSLLVVMACLIGVNPKLEIGEVLAFSGMSISYLFSLFYVTQVQSKYFTLFWVEGIPFLGLIIYYIKTFI